MFIWFALLTSILAISCLLEALTLGRKRLLLLQPSSSNEQISIALKGNINTTLIHFAFIGSLAPLVLYAIRESANFELMLIIAACSGGVIIILDKILLKRLRVQAIELAQSRGNDQLTAVSETERGIMEWGRSFTGILALVIILRAFVMEPFQIPSGSMLPTLRVGDFLVVNKFAYGLRLPLSGSEVLDIADPKAGDVVVFKRKKEVGNGFEHWIKRVVAGPGDHIMIDWNKKIITVNGEALSKDFVEANVLDPQVMNAYSNQPSPQMRFSETINGVQHQLYNDMVVTPRPARITEQTIPDEFYFVMGDNRDHSKDSRYIGLIAEQDIVGKAFAIWMHFEGFDNLSFSRVGIIK